MLKDFVVLFFTLCSWGILFKECSSGPLYWNYKRTKYSSPRRNCSFWHEIQSKRYPENVRFTVKPIEETGPFVNTRCHCKNGGTCYNHGRCYCEFPYTGRYCEQVQQAKLQCPDPGFVSNADRFSNYGRPLSKKETFQVKDKIFYVCHRDFVLYGPAYIICRESGSWSAQTPQCKPFTQRSAIRPQVRTCPDPGFVSNAVRLAGNGYNPLYQIQTFQVNDTVIFECNNGFVIVGLPYIQCLESGLWSNQLPLCEQPLSSRTNSCPDPGFVPFARRTNGLGQLSSDEDTFPVNAMLVYECAINYTLVGASLISCLGNGSWSNSVPICAVKYFPNLQLNIQTCCIDQGINTTATRVYWPVQRPNDSNCPMYHLGDVLEFNCNASGEFLLGRAVLTCMPFGVWSDIIPDCLNYVEYWNTTWDDMPFNELCPVFVRGQITTEAPVTYDYGITVSFGQRAGRQQFPWIVAISNLTSRNRWSVICSATLLNRNTALTAAHCVESLTTNGSRLYFGKYYRMDYNDDEFVQIARPTEFIIHPDYNKITYDSDIAIIKFYPPVTYTRIVHPACLSLPTTPLSENDFNATYFGVVAGWGLTERRLFSDYLEFIWIPIVPSDICRDAFRRMNANVTISSNMLCAGDRQGAVGPCRADSGGGLFFPTEDQRSFVLVGIVSFGAYPECERSEMYDFFTNVANFVPWIEEYL